MIDELKTFDIHTERPFSERVALSDLFDKEMCIAFLREQMVEIKAPNISVTASMLIKRYAHVVVSSTLYSMVTSNRALHLPLEACTLSKDRKLYIVIEKCGWQEGNNKPRDDWRKSVLTALFSTHMTPILQLMKKFSRIPSSILWENVAIRVNSVYRKTMAKDLTLIQVEHVKSDFHFLKHAPGEVFGLRENPISQYLKIGDELKLYPTRKTCCLYCKLEDDVEAIGYCSICPLKSK